MGSYPPLSYPTRFNPIISKRGIPQASAFFDPDVVETSTGKLFLSAADCTAGGLDITDDISLEIWVKPEAFVASGWTNLLRKDQVSVDAAPYTLRLSESGKNFIFLWYKVSNAAVSQEVDLELDPPGFSSPFTGSWVHFAATRDMSTGEQKIYVNGDVIDTVITDIGVAIKTNPGELQLGAFGQWTNYSFGGSMAEVRIWDTVRSPTEIANNYRKQLSGSESGLQLYLPLHSDLNDLTANGNDFSSSGTPPPVISSSDRPF